MSTHTGEIVRYLLVEDDGLEVDPIYQELQQRGPVKVQLPYGEPCWLATRYEDVRTVYRDRRFSRRTPPGVEAPGVWTGAGNIDSTFPLGMDPPEHTKLRRVTAPVFSPRNIRGQEVRGRQLVDALLDRLVEQGPPADFVATFSWDLPIDVLTGMLGVRRSDADSFRGWVEATTAFETGEEERAAVHQHLEDYIAALIAERRRQRHDDLLALLVDARDQGERLSEVELQGLVMCSTAKVGLVRSLGADHVIDYTRDEFVDGQHRYDVILDVGGNRRLSHLRRALTRHGTLVIVGGETGGRWLGGFDRSLRAELLSPP